MNKLIYIAAYEVILKMFFQSKTMSWILTSFGYFFQMPCVCIFLRLKSLPFFNGIVASLAPHLTPHQSHKTLLLQSFFPLEYLITWKMQ